MREWRTGKWIMWMDLWVLELVSRKIFLGIFKIFMVGPQQRDMFSPALSIVWKGHVLSIQPPSLRIDMLFPAYFLVRKGHVSYLLKGQFLSKLLPCSNGVCSLQPTSQSERGMFSPDYPLVRSFVLSSLPPSLKRDLISPAYSYRSSNGICSLHLPPCLKGACSLQPTF